LSERQDDRRQDQRQQRETEHQIDGGWRRHPGGALLTAPWAMRVPGWDGALAFAAANALLHPVMEPLLDGFADVARQFRAWMSHGASPYWSAPASQLKDSISLACDAVPEPTSLGCRASVRAGSKCSFGLIRASKRTKQLNSSQIRSVPSSSRRCGEVPSRRAILHTVPPMVECSNSTGSGSRRARVAANEHRFATPRPHLFDAACRRKFSTVPKHGGCPPKLLSVQKSRTCRQHLADARRRRTPSVSALGDCTTRLRCWPAPIRVFISALPARRAMRKKRTRFPL